MTRDDITASILRTRWPSGDPRIEGLTRVVAGMIADQLIADGVVEVTA